jgi:hypothetical protein
VKRNKVSAAATINAAHKMVRASGHSVWLCAFCSGVRAAITGLLIGRLERGLTFQFSSKAVFVFSRRLA